MPPGTSPHLMTSWIVRAGAESSEVLSNLYFINKETKGQRGEGRSSRSQLHISPEPHSQPAAPACLAALRLLALAPSEPAPHI